MNHRLAIPHAGKFREPTFQLTERMLRDVPSKSRALIIIPKMMIHLDGDKYPKGYFALGKTREFTDFGEYTRIYTNPEKLTYTQAFMEWQPEYIVLPFTDMFTNHRSKRVECIRDFVEQGSIIHASFDKMNINTGVEPLALLSIMTNTPFCQCLDYLGLKLPGSREGWREFTRPRDLESKLKSIMEPLYDTH